MWQHSTSFHWADDRRAAGRLRVLIENPSPALRVAGFTAYQDAGLDVALCTGPEGPGERCPLAEGGSCPLADAADVIVYALDRGRPATAAVLDAIRARYPDTPVAVEVPHGAPGQAADLPDGCVALPFPCSVPGQVRVIRRAGAGLLERSGSR